MCMTRPAEVVAVRGELADVRWQDEIVTVDVTPVAPVEPGDRLLIHAGLAIERVSLQEAEELEALLAALDDATLLAALQPGGNDHVPLRSA